MSRINNESKTVFIISDSTGKTAETLFNAVAIQFDISNLETNYFTNVTTLEELSKVIDQAKDVKNAIIAYTLILPEFCEYIEDEADKFDIPTLDILGPPINRFSQILDCQPQLEVGLNYKIDKEIFKKIECVYFNVRVDSGKDLNKLKDADIILIGVSRTSKTPLSMFLAYKNLKVATISLFPEAAPPKELYKISPKVIFGLTISADMLKKIRENRLELMDFSQDSDYASLDRIEEELNHAEEIMNEVGCKKIDITYKGIEEIVEEIISELN